MMYAAHPIVTSWDRPLGLRQLARAGGTLVGQLVAVDAAACTLITAWHLTSLPARRSPSRRSACSTASSRDSTWMTHLRSFAPALDLACPDPPAVADLNEIAAVIWASGFAGEFGWLPPPCASTTGDPATPAPEARSPGCPTSARSG